MVVHAMGHTFAITTKTEAERLGNTLHTAALADNRAKDGRKWRTSTSHRWGSKSHRKTHNCEKLTHSLRQALRQA